MSKKKIGIYAGVFRKWLAFAIDIVVLGIIAFSYIAALLVFILFHPQHRGLHDILSGVYVVKVKQFNLLKKIEKQRYFKIKDSINKPKKITFVLIILISIVVTLLSIFNPVKNSFFNELVALSEEVNKIEGVKSSETRISAFHPWSRGEANTTLQITAAVDRETFFDEKKLVILDTKIKQQAKTYYLNKHEVDEVQVKFTSGFSIGISTFNESINMQATS